MSSPSPAPSTPPPRPSARGPIIIVLIALVAVVVIALQRRRHDENVRIATAEMAVPTVAVMHPQPGPAQTVLTLPGDVQAFYSAPIYARTSGYLKRWYVDIGAEVHSGQLLADIESPEVDQQLDQARAQQAQAKANLVLAQITAERWQSLLARHAVSQQDVDERTGALAADEAALTAAEANVGRLEQLQSFERVTAPFDGVITDRQTDIGDLIDAGSAGPAAALFRIEQVRTLRVYAQVPEIYGDSMANGTPATLDFASAPGQVLHGQVTSTARAIDPASRTLLTEVQVPNPDRRLLAGSYAQVHFQITLAHPKLVLPINTLLFRPAGTEVGVVGPDSVVAMKKVVLGRNFGTTVEVDSGLEPTDEVIVNPSDSLTAGLQVRVAQPPQGASR